MNDFRRGNSFRGGSSMQPDESQFSALRRGIRTGDVPFEQVVAYLNAHNLPPQLRQTPYVKVVTTTAPILLIPANPNRMSFVIGAISADANAQPLFGYNAPLQANFGGLNNVGIPFGINTSYQEGNGTVSIDDIYLMLDATPQSAVCFIGYEGVLAIESHLHSQTTGG
jgi:hypothetical protein